MIHSLFILYSIAFKYYFTFIILNIGESFYSWIIGEFFTILNIGESFLQKNFHSTVIKVPQSLPDENIKTKFLRIGYESKNKKELLLQNWG